MIAATLSDISRYRGLSKNLDMAFDWLVHASWRNLPVGKHPIQEDNIYALVQEYTTKEHDICRFETHRKYIDIQIVLSGEEIIETISVAALTSVEPYISDIEFYSMPRNGKAHALRMIADCLAVFFPEDAHRPGMKSGKDPVPVKKIVVKVAV